MTVNKTREKSNAFFIYSSLRSEGSIIPESMAQDFGFTVVLGKQAHSWLRNCFCSAAVEPKDKLDSGIIESSLLSSSDWFSLCHSNRQHSNVIRLGSTAGISAKLCADKAYHC